MTGDKVSKDGGTEGKKKVHFKEKKIVKETTGARNRYARKGWRSEVQHGKWNSPEGASSGKHHQSKHPETEQWAAVWNTKKHRFPLPDYQKTAFFLKHTFILDQENNAQ